MGFEIRDFNVGVKLELLGSTERREEHGPASGDIMVGFEVVIGSIECDSSSQSNIVRNPHLNLLTQKCWVSVSGFSFLSMRREGFCM